MKVVDKKRLAEYLRINRVDRHEKSVYRAVGECINIYKYKVDEAKNVCLLGLPVCMFV